MRIPFVGETLHFYNFPKSTHPGPQAATVAYYWDEDESVNLMVIDPHGTPYAASSVEVIQPGEKPPEKRAYCEFITQEDREPDVDIKKNIDGKKAATPNPYASGPKT